MDSTKLAEVVEQLNEQLGDVTPYKLAVVDPADLLHVEKNAHYMPAKVYRQLVSNIKKDRNLSSVPFCWRREDGKLVVLSGNHRVDAARDAQVEKIIVLYTDAQMGRSEQIAIQLSHNSLIGSDDPQALRELWREIIDLEFKQYTGLDEVAMSALDAADMDKIRGGKMPMEDLHLLFLPDEIEYIDEAIKEIARKKGKVYAAPLSAWEEFFETLLNFKEAAKVYNSATALLEMTKIVMQWIDARGEVASKAKEEQNNV
jgi:hypothetical protein